MEQLVKTGVTRERSSSRAKNTTGRVIIVKVNQSLNVQPVPAFIRPPSIPRDRIDLSKAQSHSSARVNDRRQNQEPNLICVSPCNTFGAQLLLLFRPPTALTLTLFPDSYYFMMLMTADRFAALLQGLGLSQGLFKPVPSLLAPHRITTNTINNTQASNASAADVAPPLLDTVNNFRTPKRRDISCHVDPYDAPDIEDQAFAPFNQTEANVFRYRQQQSVNLGSW
jgi:hypothetical protein